MIDSLISLDGVSDYPTPSAHVVLSDVMSARRDEHSLPSARMTHDHSCSPRRPLASPQVSYFPTPSICVEASWEKLNASQAWFWWLDSKPRCACLACKRSRQRRGLTRSHGARPLWIPSACLACKRSPQRRVSQVQGRCGFPQRECARRRLGLTTMAGAQTVLLQLG